MCRCGTAGARVLATRPEEGGVYSRPLSGSTRRLLLCPAGAGSAAFTENRGTLPTLRRSVFAPSGNCRVLGLAGTEYTCKQQQRKAAHMFVSLKTAHKNLLTYLSRLPTGLRSVRSLSLFVEIGVEIAPKASAKTGHGTPSVLCMYLAVLRVRDGTFQQAGHPSSTVLYENQEKTAA